MAKRPETLVPLRPTGLPYWDLENCNVLTYGFTESRKQDYNRHLRDLQGLYELYVAKMNWKDVSDRDRLMFKQHLVKEIGMWSHTLKTEWRTAILNHFLEYDHEGVDAILSARALRFILEAVNIHMGSVEAAAGLENLFKDLDVLFSRNGVEAMVTAVRCPIKIPESLVGVPDESRREKAAQLVFDEFEKLQNIMSAKGEALFAKWNNMNRDQRANVLKGAWSDISDNKYEALRAVMSGDFQSATEQAYKWPDFNIENLVFQENLFLYLYSRIVMDPHCFVHHDHQSWRLAREFGQVKIPWCPGAKMAFLPVGASDKAETVESYGVTVKEANTPKKEWVVLKDVDALLTLEIQGQIYTFLNGVCRELAGDELGGASGDASAAFNLPDKVPAGISEWMTKLVNISNAIVHRQVIPSRNAATASPRVTISLAFYMNTVAMGASNKENESSTFMRHDPINFGHKLKLYVESYKRIQRVFGKGSSNSYKTAGLGVFLKSELRALCTTHFIRNSFGDVFECVRAIDGCSKEEDEEYKDRLLVQYIALLKGISHYIEIESKPIAETVLGFSDSVVNSIHWKDHDIPAPKDKKSKKKSGHYTVRPGKDYSVPVDILLSLRDILEDGDNSNHVRKHVLRVFGQGNAFEFLNWHSYMNKDSLGWSTAQCENSKLKLIAEISYLQEGISNWYPRCDPVIGDSEFGLEEPVAKIVDKFKASLNALDTFVNKHIDRLWELAAHLLTEIDTLKEYWKGSPMPDNTHDLLKLAETTTDANNDALQPQMKKASIKMTLFWTYFRDFLVEEKLVPGPEENQDDPSDILPAAIQSALLSAPWNLEYQNGKVVDVISVTRQSSKDQDAEHGYEDLDKEKGQKPISSQDSRDDDTSDSSPESPIATLKRSDAEDEANEPHGNIKGKEPARSQASGDEDKGKETSPGKRPREEIEGERSEEPPSKRTKSEKKKTRGVADPSKDTKRRRDVSDEIQETPYKPTRLPVSSQSHRLLTIMYGDQPEKLIAGRRADFADLVQTLADLGFMLTRIKGSLNHFKVPKRWQEHGSITFHRPHPDYKLDPSIIRKWIDRLGKYPIEEEFKEGLFDPMRLSS